MFAGLAASVCSPLPLTPQATHLMIIRFIIYSNLDKGPEFKMPR
jgi:hypothetical protein